MAAWIGRQGGRCCALAVSGGLLLATALFGRVNADEPAHSDLGIPIPRLIHQPQFAESMLPSASQVDAGRPHPESPARPMMRRRSALEDRVKVVKRPSSARAVRREAVAALPLAKMTEENRRRLSQVINGSSIFRELPTYRFEVDPRAYRFFMDHPEVAVGIWRVMKISDFQMRQVTPDRYETDDGSGTSGVIDVVYRGQNEVVALCEGIYKSSLLPTAIRATGALHVQLRFERGPDGRTYATHTARAFVAFPSQTVETAARIMSPVSNAIIDQNLREVSLFLNMMSMAMQRQPGWVEHIANRLDGIAASRKTELMEVTVAVYVAANSGARHSGRAPLNRGSQSSSGPINGPKRAAMSDKLESSSLRDDAALTPQ